jgi:acylphosphatase
MNSNNSRARFHAIVRGRVQGVSFRWATRETAENLGLGGWVRNLPDGSVEAEAEGDRAVLDDLIAFLHRGPPGARVDSVTITWHEPAGQRDFTIR